MTITSERATQKSTTLPRRSVHQRSFLWASFACQEEGAFYDPAFGRVQGCGSALLGDLRDEPALQQARPSGLRVVAAVEVDARALGHHPQRPGGVQSGTKKGRVVAVGGGRNGPKGDAPPVHGHRTLGAPFAAVDRAPSRLLCLGYAAVHRQLRELQADETIVGFEHHRPQGVDRPRRYPRLLYFATSTEQHKASTRC